MVAPYCKITSRVSQVSAYNNISAVFDNVPRGATGTRDRPAGNTNQWRYSVTTSNATVPDETQKVRILTGDDTISSDVFEVTGAPDHRGNFLLVSIVNKGETPRKVRAHPSRMLKINPEGSSVYRSEDNTTLYAKCPKCSAEIPVEIGAEIVMCPDHAGFPVDWSKVDAGVRPHVAEVAQDPKSNKKTKQAKASAPQGARRSKQPLTIDFAAMKANGEVWTKSGVEFDYPEFEVLAHVLVIDDGTNSRKLCFNSYNKTWGKKSKDDDLKLFFANKVNSSGKNVGYYLKNGVDAERKKLEKSGYTMEK